MAWTTPETGFSATDGLTNTHMNEIGENLNVLHKGNGHTSLSTISADVGLQLDVGTVDQSFNVNGSYNVAYITTTGRQPGNCIFLIKTGGSVSISYGAGTVPAGYGEIYGDGAASGTPTWNTGRMITLVFDGTVWHHDITGTP